DVRLYYGNLCSFDPLAYLPARSRQFRATNPNRTLLRQASMSVQIVVLQRCFRKVDVTVVNLAKDPERIVPIMPPIAKVEHHSDAVPKHTPALSDGLDKLAVGYEV